MPTHDRCLTNGKTGQVIACSIRWIQEVLIMEEGPLEDGKILLIIDASKAYFYYMQHVSTKRVARLSVLGASL